MRSCLRRRNEKPRAMKRSSVSVKSAKGVGIGPIQLPFASAVGGSRGVWADRQRWHGKQSGSVSEDPPWHSASYLCFAAPGGKKRSQPSSGAGT